MESYPDQEGRKVWLSSDEADQLVNRFEDTTKKIAIDLGLRCGLRSAEILDVTPEHVADTDAGTMLRVPSSAKTNKYRETPMPPDLATQVRTVADVRDGPRDEPLVSVSTRTLRRWIQDATEQLQEETGESGWQYVGMHDLRRTWATGLRSADVDAMCVCDWGGWESLETFLDHYRGTHSPDAQLRERNKVDWL